MADLVIEFDPASEASGVLGNAEGRAELGDTTPRDCSFCLEGEARAGRFQSGLTAPCREE